MKSACEMAMSRPEAKSPTVKINEAQKTELAEIDNLYQARIAERRVFLMEENWKVDLEGRVQKILMLRLEFLPPESDHPMSRKDALLVAL
jgi:hypothetical protein